MASLDRATLLKTAKTNRKTITIESFGGDVCIRALTFGERKEIAVVFGDDASPTDLYTKGWLEKIFAWVVVDEDGNRLFDPSSEEDLKQIAELIDGAGLQQVVEEVFRHSGLTKDGATEAKNESATQ